MEFTLFAGQTPTTFTVAEHGPLAQCALEGKVSAGNHTIKALAVRYEHGKPEAEA